MVELVVEEEMEVEGCAASVSHQCTSYHLVYLLCSKLCVITKY